MSEPDGECGFCGRPFSECAYGPGVCDDRFLASLILSERIIARTEWGQL